MDFQISIDIDAPADTVWRVMADVERWPGRGRAPEQV